MADEFLPADEMSVLDPTRTAVVEKVVHVGTWTSELGGSRRLWWSPESCRIFGLPPDGFTGKVEQFYAHVPEEDRALVRRAGDAAIAGDGPCEVEHRIVRVDGQIRWTRETIGVVRDENGTPLRLVGIVRDVTESRRLEEQFRQLQKLQVVEHLAGTIARDLTNALTAIAGYTELALGQLSAEDPAARDIQNIRHAAERAEAATRQLLALTQQQPRDHHVFSLVDMITSLEPVLDQLLGDAAQLTTAWDAGLPVISGDEGQIEQVVINLTAQARHAIPRGGRLAVALSVVDMREQFVRTRQAPPPGRYVELRISGSGAETNDSLPNAEPSFVATDRSTPIGIRFAMINSIVRQNGGYLFVESDRGQETVFHLYFPDGSAAEPSARNLPHAVLAAVRPAGQRAVLVVDDDAAACTLAVTSLGHHGYRVLSAFSGDEALAIASAGHTVIDLLVTAVALPDMTGSELANQLVEKRPGLPVVLLSTSEGSVDDTGDAGDAGDAVRTENPVSTLARPFTPRSLRRAVADAFES